MNKKLKKKIILQIINLVWLVKLLLKKIIKLTNQYLISQNKVNLNDYLFNIF